MTIDDLIALLEDFTKRYGAKVESHRHFQRIHRIALAGMGVLLTPETGEPIETSGIRHVRAILESRFPGRIFTIFDVGANIGRYSRLLQECLQGLPINIHAFEPSIFTFEILQRNLSGSDVRLHNFGFGDAEADLQLFANAPGSEIASLNNRRLTHYGIKLHPTETVKIRTIDDFCTENSIEQIDFLKLDTEGNELKCLEGAKNMINNKKIEVIQFEFGGTNIDSKTYLQDFFYTLSGYDIYRVLLDGLVKIPNYSELEEIFTAQNFIAVRRTV